jgi:hypothetical protein
MSQVIRETLQTVGVAAAAFVLLTLLALFFKAESATWTSNP